jgi:hypothetical protein
VGLYDSGAPEPECLATIRQVELVIEVAEQVGEDRPSETTMCVVALNCLCIPKVLAEQPLSLGIVMRNIADWAA